MKFSDHESVAVRILFTVLLENPRRRQVVMFGLASWAARAGTSAALRRDVSRVIELLLTAPDEIFVKRFAFFLRKSFDEDRKTTAALATLTAEVLKEIR